MIHFIKSAESYVHYRSQIKFIINLTFNIYFYISRFAIYNNVRMDRMNDRVADLFILYDHMDVHC